MSLALDAVDRIERLKSHLLALTPAEITHLVDKGGVLAEPAFDRAVDGDLAHFYAPFDWVNDGADIVLIGITPGQHQAKQALLTLRRALGAGRSPAESAAEAKQAASFDGEMRSIAVRLMDRFDLHRLFGLTSCADLFGLASQRVHYTSMLRYPVLTRKPGGPWKNYSGAPDPFHSPLLTRLFEEWFVPEIVAFSDAWLVPFGPVPAAALVKLAKRGVIRADRVLAGMNHPSGTQWNRHNCQLNTTADHSDCARNVGCSGLRARSAGLEACVATLLISGKKRRMLPG